MFPLTCDWYVFVAQRIVTIHLRRRPPVERRRDEEFEWELEDSVEPESIFQRLWNVGQSAVRGVLRILSGPGGYPTVTPASPYRDPAPRDCSVLGPDDCSGPCGYMGTGRCGMFGNTCVCKGSLQEGESFLESELEEFNPGCRVYTAALMEHLGRAAAEAESQAAAEAFMQALIPVAMQGIGNTVAPELVLCVQHSRGIDTRRPGAGTAQEISATAITDTKIATESNLR
jgi:hypothetical protein